MKKTLINYCDQTMIEKLSMVTIDNDDIDRGDTDIKDMTTSIIKSMNIQSIYSSVKLTVEGIRFLYKNSKFYLKYNNGIWLLTNRTMQDYLESEAYENRWHKYDDFTGVPDIQSNQEQ